MTIADFSWVSGDAVGHVSYVLIALSYYLTSIYWLRVTAVAGLLFEIIYFQTSGGALSTGIGWDIVFILINLQQIYRLRAEDQQLKQMADAQLLRQGVLSSLKPAQLARLVTTGYWRSLESGWVLTTQGELVTELVLICEGQALVEVNGVQVARLGSGTFVGEMALVSGKLASATVRVSATLRAFVFDLEKLRQLMTADESVAIALHQVLGRDLVQKLKLRNAE